MRLATLLLVSIASLCGCDRIRDMMNKDHAGPGASASATAATASAAQTSAECRPAKAGGMVLPLKAKLGSVTIAAAGGKALVVNSRFEEDTNPNNPDPVGSTKNERFAVNAAGAMEWSDGVPDGLTSKDEAGRPTLTFASAVAYEKNLQTAAYTTQPSGAAGCSGGMMLMRPKAGSPLWMAANYCKLADGIAASARDDFAIAAIPGFKGEDLVQGNPPTLDVLLFVAGKSKGNARLDVIKPASEGNRTKVEVLASAVGTTLAAVAYRVDLMGPKELRVVRVDRAGKRVGQVATLEKAPSKGRIGAPHLAIDGDAVQIVWASRPGDSGAFALKTASWDPNAPAPSPAVSLATGTASAFAPSVAVDGKRWAVAWMEGDEKTGVVKAGSGTQRVEDAVAKAAIVSTPGTNARDPEIAVSQGDVFVAWQEFPQGKEELRVTTVQCAE
jgi:hypothetical protein